MIFILILKFLNCSNDPETLNNNTIFNTQRKHLNVENDPVIACIQNLNDKIYEKAMEFEPYFISIKDKIYIYISYNKECEDKIYDFLNRIRKKVISTKLKYPYNISFLYIRYKLKSISNKPIAEAYNSLYEFKIKCKLSQKNKIKTKKYNTYSKKMVFGSIKDKENFDEILTKNVGEKYKKFIIIDNACKDLFDFEIAQGLFTETYDKNEADKYHIFISLSKETNDLTKDVIILQKSIKELINKFKIKINCNITSAFYKFRKLYISNTDLNCRNENGQNLQNFGLMVYTSSKKPNFLFSTGKNESYISNTTWKSFSHYIAIDKYFENCDFNFPTDKSSEICFFEKDYDFYFIITLKLDNFFYLKIYYVDEFISSKNNNNLFKRTYHFTIMKNLDNPINDKKIFSLSFHYQNEIIDYFFEIINIDHLKTLFQNILMVLEFNFRQSYYENKLFYSYIPIYDLYLSNLVEIPKFYDNKCNLNHATLFKLFKSLFDPKRYILNFLSYSINDFDLLKNDAKNKIELFISSLKSAKWENKLNETNLFYQHFHSVILLKCKKYENGLEKTYYIYFEFFKKDKKIEKYMDFDSKNIKNDLFENIYNKDFMAYIRSCLCKIDSFRNYLFLWFAEYRRKFVENICYWYFITKIFEKDDFSDISINNLDQKYGESISTEKIYDLWNDFQESKVNKNLIENLDYIKENFYDLIEFDIDDLKLIEKFCLNFCSYYELKQQKIIEKDSNKLYKAHYTIYPASTYYINDERKKIYRKLKKKLS
ncbi:hypothetical protein GVAV_002206 [Gurleya vavrai]